MTPRLKAGPGRDGAETSTEAPQRPFIIWTLQRTGGTNLTHHLKRRSGLGMAEHEPFNPPRSYGHITRAWKRTRDPDALEAAVRAVCARGENIKHCVEMVPRKVSESLLKASCEADFRHLLLYRRDTVGRLLSMEYAQRTKVWGPGHIDKAAGDALAFETPLDVPSLIAHEKRCIDLLNWAWRRLRKGGARPVALAYEDMYGPDETLALGVLSQTLRGLDLARGPADAPLIAEVRSRGDQNTRDRYARFQGIDALRQQAAALPKLRFASQTAPAVATDETEAQ